MIIVDLDPVLGREQSGGARPCIVVSVENSGQRFREMVVVVPVTGTPLGALYPVVQPYPRGLSKPSTVLVDMIRGIDKMRVRGHLAALPRADLERVNAALRTMLGL